MSGPGRSEPPKLTSGAAWWSVAKHVFDGSLDHRVTGLAAEVAFFSLFALPPSLVALFAAIGYVGELLGPDVVARARSEAVAVALRFLTPQAVHQVLEPTLDTLLTEGRADLLSVGVLFAIWSASRAADAMLDALHVAYALDERLAMWHRRGLALLYTVVGVLWGALLLPLLVAGPDLGRAIARPLGLEATFEAAWQLAYWPVLGSALLFSLAAVYHFAMPWRTPYLRDLPGAAFALALWSVGSAALRSYARWVVESSPVYGALASPMVLLLWLYFTAFSVLMGAELNAALERTWPTLTRKERKAILRAAVKELEERGEEVAPVSVTGPPKA